MQTFLPLPTFFESARCLDAKRLGKQRVEAKQILLCLGVPIGEHETRRKGWANHPATRMWRGHEVCLLEYAIAVCQEWRLRGYRDTLLPQFCTAWREAIGDARFGMNKPRWIGADEFHRSHRSNLLRKDPVHYGRFGWLESPDIPYYWPT